MNYDVIIAGAGPVGLFLACELRLAGVSVLLLEQAETPDSPLKRLPFGMRGLTVPTVEAFYRRGLLDVLMDIGKSSSQPRRQAGHFAGIPLDLAKIDTSKWPYRLTGPVNTNMAAEMARIESVLVERAIALGAEIRRGFAVNGLIQSESHITVMAGDLRVDAKWLVGCDGGRSAIRKLGNFDFVGTDPEFTGYTAQVDLADPEKLAPGRNLTAKGMYFQTQPGHLAMLEFDGGAFHRSAPITPEHLQAVLRRVSGTDVTIAAMHVATSWTDRAQQVTNYRNGRVLLAGDAAHIHSPLGGQGLNAGLGDAMNLGWKLAAVIKGISPEVLLDSYHTERHPMGAQVLDWTRAQVAIMRPDPHARATERLMRALINTSDGATCIAEQVWGVSLQYELDGDHPLVGRSAPDFEFADGRRLGELLRTGQGLLLDFVADSDLGRLATPWSQQVSYLSCRVKNSLGLHALLIRPDGVVAWATNSDVDTDQFKRIVMRWFGGES